MKKKRSLNWISTKTMSGNPSKSTGKNDIYYFEEGWKQKINNITKIYVKGTDYQRGLQLGTLMAKEIKSLIKSYLSFSVLPKSNVSWFLKGMVKWMPFLFGMFFLARYREKVEKQIQKYPPWMIHQLEGMAKGAGVNPLYLKLINSISDAAQALGHKELNARQSRSCCSFAFIGDNGCLYHGKNLDWVQNEGFIDLICFQQHEDENGNWFAIIGPPGLLNNFEYGINSHGISIGLTGRFYRGSQASQLTLTNVLELNILRYGKNLEEIRKMYKTKTGFNRVDALLISSVSDKDYKLFEVTPRGVAMTSAEAGKLFNTNTYVHPKLQSFNRQWGTIYDGQFRDPRYIRFQELMSRGPKTSEDAFAILSDTRQPGFENKSFLGQATINRFITHISVLVTWGEIPGVWIARDHTYAAYNEYIFFDFSSQPQQKIRQRPAHKIIYEQTFKIFKDFMHLRETRYYTSPAKLLKNSRKLLKKEPDNPIFILFLAQNQLKYHRFHQALDLLNRHPLEWCADYWYCLGRCYSGLKQYEKAKESFQQAIARPPIDGFPEMVQVVCLIQLLKINRTLGLHREVSQLTGQIQEMQSKFATPHIGMPDYPYINNFSEQMEEIVL